MRVIIPTLLLATACGSSEPPPSLDPLPDPPVEGPTYAQDVAPLISEHCGACHVEDGIAPFPLTTYAETSIYAETIKYAVMTGAMPPWMPGGATPPLAHDRSLDDDVIRTIAEWVDGGAIEGDPSQAAPLIPPAVIPFEDPDLTVRMAEPYALDTDLTDDYRCFLIDLGMTEDRVLTAFRITPGNRSTVHHVITNLYDAADRTQLEAEDAGSPGPGWTCFGGAAASGRPSGSLGSWVPGVSAVVYPEGTGSEVLAGLLAVMQVHYNLLANSDPDQTQIELRFAPKGASIEPIRGIRMIDPMLSIPPGESDHTEENTLAVDRLGGRAAFSDDSGFVLGVAGHMHTLAIRFELSLVKSDGAIVPVLEIPSWDFHWQGSYQLIDLLPISNGDSVRIRCTYDNTAEHRTLEGMDPTPTTVIWGEGTQDEMCLGSLLVVDQL